MVSIEPIHILHVVRRAEGGILAHVSDLFAGLDDRFAQSLAAPKDVFDSLPDRARVANFMPIDVGDKIGPGTLVKAAGLAAWARKIGADVIHAHGYKAAVPGAIAARLSGRRLIVTGHNMFPSDASGAARASIGMVSRLATKFIAVSPSLAKSLVAAGVDESKIVVVAGGVDLKSFRSGDRDAGRSAMGAGDARIVLVVARLTGVKGVDVLIRAAADVLKLSSGVRFVVAGDGPDRASLEALADEIAPGTVTFLGYRNDVPNLIAAADVVAVPSIAEGYGLIAVQAMAAGRPVVASDVGGLADNIRNDETGLLVPSGDPEALARGIIRLLESPELGKRLGDAASKYASTEFGMELMISRTQEVYECVVS